MLSAAWTGAIAHLDDVRGVVGGHGPMCDGQLPQLPFEAALGRPLVVVVTVLLTIALGEASGADFWRHCEPPVRLRSPLGTISERFWEPRNLKKTLKSALLLSKSKFSLFCRRALPKSSPKPQHIFKDFPERTKNDPHRLKIFVPVAKLPIQTNRRFRPSPELGKRPSLVDLLWS